MNSLKGTDTVICFGDSNTWGFDPSNGCRYSSDNRWVDILEKLSGVRTVNAGLNGRQIPHTEYEKKEVMDLLDRAQKGEFGNKVLFLILLGDNDIQMNYGFTAEDAVNRMRMLLNDMLFHDAVMSGRVDITILGPANAEPGPWSTQQMIGELVRTGRLEDRLCSELGVGFINLYDTEIELSDDGDHFSPAGHRQAAEYLYKML